MEETLELALSLRRRHPRMTHLWEAVGCPFCHAAVGDPCRTSRGGVSDVSHSVRISLFRMVPV